MERTGREQGVAKIRSGGKPGVRARMDFDGHSEVESEATPSRVEQAKNRQKNCQSVVAVADAVLRNNQPTTTPAVPTVLSRQNLASSVPAVLRALEPQQWSESQQCWVLWQ